MFKISVVEVTNTCNDPKIIKIVILKSGKSRQSDDVKKYLVTASGFI